MSQEQKKIVSIQLLPHKLNPYPNFAVITQPEGSDMETKGWGVYTRFTDGTVKFIDERRYEAGGIKLAKELCKHHGVPLEPYPWQDTVPVSFIPNLTEYQSVPGRVTRFPAKHLEWTEDAKQDHPKGNPGLPYVGRGLPAIQRTFIPSSVHGLGEEMTKQLREETGNPDITILAGAMEIVSLIEDPATFEPGLVPSMELGKALLDQAKEQCETRESRWTDVDVAATYPKAEDNDAKYGGDATPSSADASSATSSDPDTQ